MKLDKDTVIKHQFWFLLGGFLLFWIIAVFWLKGAATASDGPIEKAKGEYKGKSEAVKKASSDPVNVATFLPPWIKQFDVFNLHKGTVWTQAWNGQSYMYNWPEEWMKSKDMYTPQTPLDYNECNDYKTKYYPRQIETLETNAPKWISPIELAKPFKEIFEPAKLDEVPTREECWLVQEDYWVKRELFAVLWRAMNDLAYMAPVEIPKDEKTPEGVDARYRFANQNWEITLNLRKGSKGLALSSDSTIKNVHPTGRVQSLTSAKGKPIAFNVAQGNTHAQFYVQGEPVAWNEVRTFNPDKDAKPTDYESLPGISWDDKAVKEHPVLVSQAFDISTSPIRRLDAMKLAQQDCRTFVWLLQPNQELAQLDAPAEDPNAKNPAGGGGAPGQPGMPGASPGGPGAPMGMPGPAPGGGVSGKPGAGMPNPMGGPSMPGGGAETAATNETPNNHINRSRYLRPPTQDKTVNPPSRHLPFALQLIVEQTHVNDVLLTLANSPLRVQITQVDFHHAKDYKPGEPDSGSSGGAGGYFMGPSMSNYPGAGRSGPGGMPMRPGMPMGPGMSPSSPMPGGKMRMPSPGGMYGPMMGMPPPTMTRPGGRMGPGMPGPMPNPGMRPTPPQQPGENKEKPSASNLSDDNVVQVTIYGIAALYRRPDPPKKSDQPAAAPAAPVAPKAPPPTTAPAGQPTGQPAKPASNAPIGQPAGQPAKPAAPAEGKR
jgi:hypothetical protein